jgi:peptidoglycan/xylan/chitin deacetylase (PgdA/CDA1 family)
MPMFTATKFARQQYAENYSDLLRCLSTMYRLKKLVRDVVIYPLSFKLHKMSTSEWIRFPYYHHVFDDERRGFKRQLLFMRTMGEFISLDNAVDLLREKQRLGGRYFCITFDDGFKNLATNAWPILAEFSCPAAVFVATDYIGSDIHRDQALLAKFYATAAYPRPIEFLSWDDCRQLLKMGATIGSHTCSHVRISELPSEALQDQLRKSKEAIETELGISCHHFSAPWGRPSHDFRKETDPIMALKIGYTSFLTSERGPNFQGQSPLHIRRDQLRAGWGNYQLRYFFSRTS